MKDSEYPTAVCIEVARLLTEERERQGISENRLAAAAGLSQSLMTRLKKNINSPNLDSLVRIASALEVDLGRLISRAIRNVEKGMATDSAPSKGKRSKA